MNQFYKYTSIDQRLFQNIINGTLWFANLDSFNDPFEFQKPVNYGASEKSINSWYDVLFQSGRKNLYFDLTKIEFIKTWEKKGRLFEKDIKINLEKELNNIGILSLSKNCTNIQMWAHYADSHKGVCLVFDTNRGTIFPKQDYWKVNYPLDGHYQVLFDENTDVKKSQFGLILTKAQAWKEEQEYRVFQNKRGLYNYNKETLSSLIFGYNCKTLEKQKLKKIVNGSGYKDVIFQEIKLHEDEYKLILKKC